MKQSYERIPVDKIVAELNNESETLCSMWLGNGKQVEDGGKVCWRVGDINNSPSRKKDGIGSFSMVLTGKYRGKGKDFAYDISGKERAVSWLDVIAANIVPNRITDTPMVAAIKWAVNWLNLGKPIEAEVRQRVPVVSGDGRNIASAEQKIEWAQGIWDRGIDIDNRGSTPAELYLQRRGITLEIEPGLLRYLPRCLYRQGEDKSYFPALLCPLTNESGFRGIQRIYLTPDGSKAPVPEVKKTLGDQCGGAVRLCSDEDVYWAGRIELALCEGVETGLAIRQLAKLGLLPEMPVWCGLSTWGLSTMWLPDHISSPVVFYDNDQAQTDRDGVLKLGPDGDYIYPGLNAALSAAERFSEAEGRNPQLLDPTAMGFPGCKDFADVLQRVLVADKSLVAVR